MKYQTRLAHLDDIEQISKLIQLSARKLAGKFYKKSTIESALTGAFGVDTQLIKDQTYYLICNKDEMIACGGWSYRKTLFGSDTNNLRDAKKLNPKTKAAKIRAFFIHPEYARQGLGLQLLNLCEEMARKRGFKQAQLMSTLSGIDFYKKNGYQGDEYIDHNMDESNKIKFLPMIKDI
ncbi:MAG: GNAT family N-acetyltransferase [Alcanivoracaceae bacterium]|nr:GNAT family N-acetyltransferase [Alcanivoracaceae bacterium]